MKYVIIGAGLTGSVIAQQLAENKDNQVILLDKKLHIGGTCYDCYDQNGILIHKYGPHIFNTPDKEIWDYVNRYSEFYEYFHRVLGYVDGTLVPIPFNIQSIRTLFPEAMAERLINKLIDKYGYNCKVPVLELQSQDDKDLQFLADFVYEKVFLHYTMKQWGQKPDEVGGKAMARIPVFVSTDDRYFQNPYQGVPKYGYTEMIRNMIDAPNIEVLLGLDYHKVLCLKDGEIWFNGQKFDGKVIFTAALDGLFDYKFGPLPYRTLDFRFETMEQEEFQPVATVNYPCNYEFTRITEFKKLTMQKHAHTTIMREYSMQYDHTDAKMDPLYPIPKPENEALYNQYLEETKKYQGLVVAGRLANYRYYTMAETIKNALAIAKEL